MEFIYTVKDFVSTEAKVDAVGLTVQEAYFDGIMNPMLLEFFFKVNMFITFTESDIKVEDKIDFYDYFGPEWDNFENEIAVKYGLEMLDELWDYTLDWSTEYKDYNNSLVGIVDKLKVFGENIIDRTDQSLSAIANLNPEDIVKLTEAAKALGINFSSAAKAVAE